MPDSIELLIDGRQVDKFEEYSIESDLYVPADAFRLTLSNPAFEVKKAVRCQLKVNGSLEMTGLVERVTRAGSKAGFSRKVEGRNLMGLLVDHHVEEFIDLEDFTIKSLAEKLLRPIPFINRKAVVYGKGHAPADTEAAIIKINPGDTVFEVLARYAAARGLMFFDEPNGTFVFGKPKEKGEPEFTLVDRKDGRGNNILEGEFIEDLTKRYSKVVVVGQQQGGVDVDLDDISVTGTAVDKTFPFFKPFVMSTNIDHSSPAMVARLTLNQQRSEGFSLSYRVAGHSQGGKNWAPNSLCRVDDENRGVHGVYLIYGRTFEGSKKSGAFTQLRLGLPGIFQ